MSSRVASAGLRARAAPRNPHPRRQNSRCSGFTHVCKDLHSSFIPSGARGAENATPPCPWPWRGPCERTSQLRRRDPDAALRLEIHQGLPMYNVTHRRRALRHASLAISLLSALALLTPAGSDDPGSAGTGGDGGGLPQDSCPEADVTSCDLVVAPSADDSGDAQLGTPTTEAPEPLVAPGG